MVQENVVFILGLPFPWSSPNVHSKPYTTAGEARGRAGGSPAWGEPLQSFLPVGSAGPRHSERSPSPEAGPASCYAPVCISLADSCFLRLKELPLPPEFIFSFCHCCSPCLPQILKTGKRKSLFHLSSSVRFSFLPELICAEF